jgi:8-oxo-dGTP pyrophosphatase MutT (NUDIX family)
MQVRTSYGVALFSDDGEQLLVLKKYLSYAFCDWNSKAVCDIDTLKLLISNMTIHEAALVCTGNIDAIGEYYHSLYKQSRPYGDVEYYIRRPAATVNNRYASHTVKRQYRRRYANNYTPRILDKDTLHKINEYMEFLILSKAYPILDGLLLDIPKGRPNNNDKHGRRDIGGKECAVRELYEETNITMRTEDLIEDVEIVYDIPSPVKPDTIYRLIIYLGFYSDSDNLIRFGESRYMVEHVSHKLIPKDLLTYLNHPWLTLFNELFDRIKPYVAKHMLTKQVGVEQQTES